jgi:hypothetical protein
MLAVLRGRVMLLFSFRLHGCTNYINLLWQVRILDVNVTILAATVLGSVCEV